MRIFTGIQPSGELHLGNYVGAMKPMLELQKQHECFASIVDFHALTDLPEAGALRKRTGSAALSWLAVGLDPQRVTLFTQSDVPAHTELMWLLTTMTSIGDLERMTQYKEKSRDAGKKQFVNAGLLNYPILMAADILLYKTEGVPVGEDQAQHLELTRRIARRFNEHYPPVLLKEPESLFPKTGARVMSLRDPKRKMSKSHGPDTYVGIFDDPETIRKKIRKAVTDSGRTVAYAPKQKPALANLIELYAILAGEEPKTSAARFDGTSYASLKDALAELCIEKFSPMRERRAALEQSPAHVRTILEKGAERARSVANETLREVRLRMGIE